MKIFVSIASVAIMLGLAEMAHTQETPKPRPVPGALDIEGMTLDRITRRIQTLIEVQASKELKQSLDHLRVDDYERVFSDLGTMSDPLDKAIVSWLLARSKAPEVSAAFIKAFLEGPFGELDQTRILESYEEALFREQPPAHIALNYAKKWPILTPYGHIFLARVYAHAKRKGKAHETIRNMWHTRVFEIKWLETTGINVGKILSSKDHAKRLEFLVLENAYHNAKDLRPFLNKEQKTVLDLFSSVKNRKGEKKALKRLAKSQENSNAALFLRLKVLMRLEHPQKAAALLKELTAKQESATHPDAWARLRLRLAREFLSVKKPQMAYEVISSHQARDKDIRARNAFTAGWIALRFLNKPLKAKQHFSVFLKNTESRRKRAKAHYWLGRTYEKLKNKASADEHYKAASRVPFSFYGQLALEKSSRTRLTFYKNNESQQPEASAAFHKNRYVHMIRRLHTAGHGVRTAPLFALLAEKLTNPDDIEALAQLAYKTGYPQFAIISTAIAYERGLEAESTLFPVSPLKGIADQQSSIDTALVYGVTRQESAFYPAAVSPAGARGLMQLLPSTARETAKKIKLRYSLGRLTSDPVYNVRLGAGYLRSMIQYYNGSHVLAVAAYNGGPGNVNKWIGLYGDPRTKGVDVIDWIEILPFSETRSYIKRVLSGAQVYQNRLYNKPLSLGRTIGL